MTTYVVTVKYVPKACRPLMGEVLANELRLAAQNKIWGVARLMLVAKCILRPPVKGGSRCFYGVAKLISDRLRRWLDGEVFELWTEAKNSAGKKGGTRKKGHSDVFTQTKNIKRSLQMACKGHYAKAIRALMSKGIASLGNPEAFIDLQAKHPPPRDIPQSITVEVGDVIPAIKNFPKGSSPGWSQLRIQRLFDMTCRCTAPASQDCLMELMRWINLLLSGKTTSLLAP